jgi:hypothetical protein
VPHSTLSPPRTLLSLSVSHYSSQGGGKVGGQEIERKKGNAAAAGRSVCRVVSSGQLLFCCCLCDSWLVPHPSSSSPLLSNRGRFVRLLRPPPLFPPYCCCSLPLLWDKVPFFTSLTLKNIGYKTRSSYGQKSLPH